MNTNSIASTQESTLTTDRLADVAHEAVDGMASKAQKVEEQLRKGAANAGEQIDATRAAASKTIDQSLSSAEAFVRERPILATGIAFAAGALAMAALRR